MAHRERKSPFPPPPPPPPHTHTQTASQHKANAQTGRPEPHMPSAGKPTSNYNLAETAAELLRRERTPGGMSLCIRDACIYFRRLCLLIGHRCSFKVCPAYVSHKVPKAPRVQELKHQSGVGWGTNLESQQIAQYHMHIYSYAIMHAYLVPDIAYGLYSTYIFLNHSLKTLL